MTETELWAAFGTGLVLGGILGACGVLAYGKRELDRETRDPMPPRAPATSVTQPRPPFTRSGKGPWRAR